MLFLLYSDWILPTLDTSHSHLTVIVLKPGEPWAGRVHVWALHSLSESVLWLLLSCLLGISACIDLDWQIFVQNSAASKSLLAGSESLISIVKRRRIRFEIGWAFNRVELDISTPTVFGQILIIGRRIIQQIPRSFTFQRLICARVELIIGISAEAFCWHLIVHSGSIWQLRHSSLFGELSGRGEILHASLVSTT